MSLNEKSVMAEALLEKGNDADMNEAATAQMD